MRPWEPEYAGRLEMRTIESAALLNNPLGDSPTRPIWVYLPPGYDDDPERRFPTIYLLQGYANAIAKWGHRPAFGRTVPERFDAVFADPSTPPCVVVFVDAWTSVGGSQFINSTGIGNYHNYLCEDVIGFIDREYRTIVDGARRGLQGHSSGGFGALVNAMFRPDLFGAIASHAGDTAYDLCYPVEIANAYRGLRDLYERSYDKFFQSISQRDGMTRSSDFSLMMVYCLSACFSSNDDGSIDLPFDLATGSIIPEVFSRWTDWDPVNMVAKYPDALRSLRGVWIDAGRSDECYFDIGAERLVAELHRIGVDEVAFQIIDGRHSGNEYRYPLALRYLAERLSAPSAE